MVHADAGVSPGVADGRLGGAGLRALTARAIAEAVSRREVSAEEVVRAHLDAIEAAWEDNAIITAVREPALRRARAGVTGPLAGVPLAVKDTFDTAGVLTTWGSALAADRVPSRTAEAVARLEGAGAIVVGKANMHELAWGATSQNMRFGTVVNPRDRSRTAGGSSGGNAAALAAGLCALGLGTDTGGSIRIPSACCGTAGLKPSHGAVPMDGCLPLAPSFDTAGPMARTVGDLAVAFAALARRPVPSPGLDGRRVGLLDEAPADAAALVAQRGGRAARIAMPPLPRDAFAPIMAEAAETHRDRFPRLAHLFSADARTKWEAARAVSPERMARALRDLGAWSAACEAALPEVVVSPTLGTPEPPPVDVDERSVRAVMTRFTRPFSLLGWAAVTLPSGLQVAARDDATALAAALALDPD